MRLRTALEASLLHGTATLSWWDHFGLTWRSDSSPEDVGTTDPGPLRDSVTEDAAGLKRRLFPSTLWESGWKPRSNASDALTNQHDATIVLHSTFLAPLAARLRRSGQRVVVDVYDAVFRSHYDDARGAPLALRATRRSYACSVRARERRALARVTGLAVAGWDDMRVLSALGIVGMTWAPTGLEAKLAVQPSSEHLCVGVLGNHYHSATAQAAAELIASPLGKDPEIQVVLAGIGSDRYPTSVKVRSLGQIDTTDEFYNQIHAAVVPVMNGTGMKCKLGEAALAGKAIITTQLGAVGYPPELQEAFVIIDSPQSLSKQIVIDAVEGASPEARRQLFESFVGREAAAHTYASVLAHAGELLSAGQGSR